MIQFEHTAYNVHEPEKAAAWYVAHMDMDLVRGTSEGIKPHFIADKQRRFCWEFYSNPAGPVADQRAINPFTQHVAFAVDDMDAVRAKLLSAGCSPEGEVSITPAGDRLLFLRDPWGLTLQLVMRAVKLY